MLSRLTACGARVRALVLPEEAAFLPPEVPYTVGNVTYPDSLIPFFETDGYDTVTLIHCAAVVTIASRPHPGLWRINVGGTENVLRAAKRTGVARMIYVSSVTCATWRKGSFSVRSVAAPANAISSAVNIPQSGI